MRKCWSGLQEDRSTKKDQERIPIPTKVSKLHHLTLAKKHETIQESLYYTTIS